MLLPEPKSFRRIELTSFAEKSWIALDEELFRSDCGALASRSAAKPFRTASRDISDSAASRAKHCKVAADKEGMPLRVAPKPSLLRKFTDWPALLRA